MGAMVIIVAMTIMVALIIVVAMVIVVMVIGHGGHGDHGGLGDHCGHGDHGGHCGHCGHGQDWQDRTKLTFKLYFQSNLWRAAFAILALFILIFQTDDICILDFCAKIVKKFLVMSATLFRPSLVNNGGQRHCDLWTHSTNTHMQRHTHTCTSKHTHAKTFQTILQTQTQHCKKIMSSSVLVLVWLLWVYLW